ncbi:UDP-N-acetylmuramoyl-tripeptide--D-alanyl-D-alanine ligase [Pseudotenacibaculum sp. MALMAid0570]|uniref:UDP-N-acetylmuramoyl-tripeptide--D-alanyl-D- alanine ligase n=1 Tax=Pseudotenacibaculum sp. MALMAid0570 TaxID=3143938 RepID=UPI0032DF070E
MKIKDLYQFYRENYLVDTDTRKIRKGSIFFALKGENFNGNKFVTQALENGAEYCVIDEEKYAVKGKTFLVRDVLLALQELAKYHREQLAIPIIGLTGSNGKTTTKELIYSVLKTQHNVNATYGNLNNHIGVPLTLLSFTDKTEIGIVEMGANHQKEIEFLSNISQPDYGYITNFGKAHLEGFGGIEGVIKGKSELYTYLSKNHKKVFVNPLDSKQVELTANQSRVFLNSDEVSMFSSHPYLKINYKDISIQTHLVGEYNFTNILAAITVGEHFNVSKENIKTAIENYVPTNNRSQVIEKQGNTILLDAYNANPSSVTSALDNFNKVKHSSKVAILGDMFELGKDAAEEHQNIVELSKNLEIDRFIFVGENYYGTSAAEKYKSFENLKSNLEKSPFKDCFILIKGSRGMALERLLEIIN